MTSRVVVVSGAGGFIGGHLVDRLRRMPGVKVRAADIKPSDDWYQVFPDVENHAGPLDGDVRDFGVCRRLPHHRLLILESPDVLYH